MTPSKQNILYLTYDGLTDPLGKSQILPYLVGLSALGHTITIISFEKPYRLKPELRQLINYCADNNLFWMPLPYYNNPPVIATLYNLFVLRKRAFALYKQNKYSIIHCRSYLTSLIGLGLKKRFGVKFIFDMRGFWADERVEGGLWNLKNPLYKLIYRYFKKEEKKFITQANHIISLTENAKREIFKIAKAEVPVTVIPTCVDLHLFDRSSVSISDISQRKRELGLHEQDFVILYLGSWGTWYLIDEMLLFFSILKKTNLNAKFLIVSQDQINLKNFENKKDVIICSADRKDVPLHIALANISVFFIKPSFSKRASSATKLGEIVAMKCPVVTNRGWGDVELLKEEGSITLLEDFSPTAMQQLIDNLHQIVKHNGMSKSEIKDKLSLDNGIQVYNKVYQHL